jgi:RimJ/RimL family protein N-acetyltransferase
MEEPNLKNLNLFTPRLSLKPCQPGMGEIIYEAIVESYEMLAPWKIWVWKEKEQLTPDDYEEFISRKIQLLKEKKDITFLVFERSSNHLIGAISINKIAQDNTHGFLGFWIRKSFMQQGYALEAATKVIEFAFNKLKHAKLCAVHEQGNNKSEKTLLKLGFKLIKKEDIWVHYEYT